ncbi:chorismate mutase [Agaricicola taiwanensis]|nr:chorismate mutase [Agaricicola taiwanensis]
METLDDLRRDIDRIDAEMHALLIERGSIIDRLIAVKQGSTESGSAFRPKREADMMRALLARHTGHLPLDTVESIWRVIISTFTYVQAPYRVHGAASGGAAAERDVARFHFGFTVPYIEHSDAEAVIAAVAEDPRDLGLIPVAADGGWWRMLARNSALQVIARLPFVERPGHPAALATFVVGGTPAPGATADDVRLLVAETSGWSAAANSMVAVVGAEVLARHDTAVLIALPREIELKRLEDGLAASGAQLEDTAWIGSHAARHSVDTAGAS